VSEELEACTLALYLDELAVPCFEKEFGRGRSIAQLRREADLRGQEELLRKAERVRVLTNEDDFIIDANDLSWLQRVLGDRLTGYPTGGHLGNMHTLEFQADVVNALGVLPAVAVEK